MPLHKENWPVRPAREQDAAAIEALIPLSVRALQAAHYSPAQMDAALGPVFGVDRQLIIDGTYFVIEDEGRIIACGGWSKRRAVFGGDRARAGQDELIDPNRDPARIRAFFVHPGFARRGLGGTILSACEQAILKNGFRRAELVATLAGEPLYASFAYQVVERYEVPLAGGLTLPVVRMSKCWPPIPEDNFEKELLQIRNFLRVSPHLATSGQPTAEQFAAIATAGFQSVINLALPTSTHALPNERELVAAQSMEYVHIPVVWESPQFEDFVRFTAALQERKQRRVFVHCALNMRVSAFMFLHRTLVEGMSVAEARLDLQRIWEPDGVWPAFIAEVSARWRAAATSTQPNTRTTG